MTLDFKEDTVAVIYGGAGYEHGVSLASARNLFAVLDRSGIRYAPILIDRSGEWRMQRSPFSGGEEISTYPVRLGGISGFIAGDEVIPIGRALVLLHGDMGEDGRVQGALECAGIKVVGTGCIAGATAADKAYTKWIAASLGIPVLPAAVADLSVADTDIDEICERAVGKFGFPLFVKPCRLGSSYGAMPATDGNALSDAVKNALAYEKRIMIEPCLFEKRELECAYFSFGGVCVVTDPGEIVINGFYSFDEKYSSKSHAVPTVRAELPAKQRELIRAYTRKLAVALGVSGFARFDYFLKDSTIYFNEVNTIPGMTDTSLYLSMLAAEGIGEDRFVALMLGGGA